VTERFLVTGAHGCIGAWTVAELVHDGAEVVAFDVAPGHGRMTLLLDESELRRVRVVHGDVADHDAPRSAFVGVTHVVHLAALQFPYCRDHHVEGARVNVVGTVSVFDAALAAGAKLVYASSTAALLEGQLYGTWKRANEGTAAAFRAEDGFPSIGIRPALVYGVGRDRGVTASVTLAMQAAARGEPFHIALGGSSPLNHAGDIARIVVRAARAVSEGAPVYDAGGKVHDMDSCGDRSRSTRRPDHLRGRAIRDDARWLRRLGARPRAGRSRVAAARDGRRGDGRALPRTRSNELRVFVLVLAGIEEVTITSSPRHRRVRRASR
jgi:nucleoside-diphosphate-sugar epimerase